MVFTLVKNSPNPYQDFGTGYVIFRFVSEVPYPALGYDEIHPLWHRVVLEDHGQIARGLYEDSRHQRRSPHLAVRASVRSKYRN
jgi:hypothetical protein